MSVEKVAIKHDETGQTSTVVKSAVPVWEAHGWTVVEDEGSPQAEPEVPATDTQVTKVKSGPGVPDTSKKE